MPETVVLRRCYSCKTEKPLTDFYKNRALPLGHERQCIECHKKMNRTRKLRNRSKERSRIFSSNPENRAYLRAKSNKYMKLPEVRFKHNARQVVKRAIDTGKLIRPNRCSECGKSCIPQAHHYNGYDKKHRFDVIWPCRECHDLIHRLPDSVAERQA